MTKHIRRRVERFETRPNDHPESSRLFPDVGTAVLECGHRINLGVETEGNRYRPRRMACWECEPSPGPSPSDVKDILVGVLFAGVLTVPVVLWLTKEPPGTHPMDDITTQMPKLYQFIDVIPPLIPLQSVAPQPQEPLKLRADQYTQLLELVGVGSENRECKSGCILSALQSPAPRNIADYVANIARDFARETAETAPARAAEEIWSETRDAAVRLTPDEAQLSEYLHLEIPRPKRPLHARSSTRKETITR